MKIRGQAMSYKTYRMWQALMGMFIGAVTAVCVTLDIWIIPIPVIFAAIIALMLMRRSVNEIVHDERTSTIAGKASRLTLLIAIIGMALTGVILLLIARGESDILTNTGFGLEYAACALLIINSVAYNYYSRKLGGR
jgi:uncharacterized membrane protein